MNLEQIYNPKTSKRNLLLIAGIIWTFAGGMLLIKGFFYELHFPEYLWLKLLIGFVSGVLFFYFLFFKISLRYITRIVNLKNDKPSIFSFFGLKSYILMGFMISLGIFVRKSGYVSLEYYSVFYITMGIPLFLSAMRFFYYSFKFDLALRLKN